MPADWRGHDGEVRRTGAELFMFVLQLVGQSFALHLILGAGEGRRVQCFGHNGKVR